MNRVIALACAEEPLDFSVFLPAQVTVPVGAVPPPVPVALLLDGAELLAAAVLLGTAELPDPGAALLEVLGVLVLLDAAPLLLLPQADKSNPAAAMRLTAAVADRLSFT